MPRLTPRRRLRFRAGERFCPPRKRPNPRSCRRLPVSASARRSTSETMPPVTPPAKACCITVESRSTSTMRTRPPRRAGPTMSFVTTPVIGPALPANAHTTNREPGWKEQDRAVKTVIGEVNDYSKTENGDRQKRHPGNARCNRRLEQGEGDEGAQEGEPYDGDVGIAHMPAVEIEIGEQKDDKRRGKDRFARSAPNLLRVGRQRQILSPRNRSQRRCRQAPPSRERRRPET